MSAFKVGDRVNCVKDEMERGCGRTGVVIEVDSHYVVVDFENDFDGHGGSGCCWNFFDPDNQLVPVAKATGTLKDGDVVRCIEDYGGQFTAGKECVVRRVCHDGYTSRISVVEDDAGSKENGWLASKFVPVSSTLRIEAGKFYRTRDGRKVGPMIPARGYDSQYPFMVDHPFSATAGKAWRKDGTFNPEHQTDPADLVAEWVDEPAVAPATAKFKVGDRVEVVGGIAGNKEHFIGTFFTIDNDEGDLDGEQSWSGRDSNSPYRFKESELRLVAPATSGKAIVALLESGQPRPATRPFVHASRVLAEAEASRLAAKEPGKEFGVYELVASRKEAKVYDFEWQRLAAIGQKIGAIKAVRERAGLTLKGAKDAVEHWLELQAA